MDPLFVCPLPEALTAIPSLVCPERFGQIQRIAFQIIQPTSSFSATTILAQATWTPLLAASDETKIIISIPIAGIVIPPGEILLEGGNDNSTINGIARLNGRAAVTVTAQMQDANAAIRTAMRSVTPFSAVLGSTQAWVYLFNQFNQIIANSDGSGIPIYNFTVGDVGSEGFNRPNIANVSWSFAGGWSDTVKIFTPTAPFKPLSL